MTRTWLFLTFFLFVLVVLTWFIDHHVASKHDDKINFFFHFVIQKRTDYKLDYSLLGNTTHEERMFFKGGGSDIKIGDTRSKWVDSIGGTYNNV